MQSIDLIKTPASWCLLLVGIAAYILKRHQSLKSRKSINPSQQDKPSPQYSEESYNSITPLPDFDITSTPPLKLRPFKPIYHMTMALENTSISDLIAMDNTYSSRCAIRTHLISTQRHEVLACNPIAAPAVLELYTWLTNTYLPTRFPTIYTLAENHLHNSVTNTPLPLHLTDPERALELLGQTIDDEFLFMIPTQHPDTHPQPTYSLQAFINCFPSGFNTRSKLSLPLAAIHAPVPGYSTKLEKSMDRFFASLPVGRVVKRANWSVSTNGELFCLSGNHMAAEEMRGMEEGEEEIDIDRTVLRCERQTLHRLPGSGALVFAFKTYQYPVRELRDEGSGEVLAEAIDGLGAGSVPEITVYKRQVVWGEKVKAFLRGEIDG